MSTEKKIVDYLPYYVGCEGQLRHGEIHKLTTKILHDVLRGQIDFKPLFSKLEDMPDEDIKGLINYDKLVEMYSGVEYSKEKNRIDIKYNVDVDDFGKQLFFHSIKFYQLDPAQFHYLLKKGYDLFGLIEAGLAVDKKSLK